MLKILCNASAALFKLRFFLILGFVYAGASPAFASWWNPIDAVTDIVGSAVNMAAGAATAAHNTVADASRGDFDAVANNVIKQMTAPAFMRDELFKRLNQVTPESIRAYTQTATDIIRKIDDESGSFKAQTYKNLYNAYKNDGNALLQRLRNGNFDFSEYQKYSFHYSIMTADWSNPDAIKKSAERIARDQYEAYSWYSAHTIKGAVIGTARGKVGLTDEVIEQGIKDVTKFMYENKSLVQVGALIASEFSALAAQAQDQTIPWVHITDNKHHQMIVAGTNYDGQLYHQAPGGRKNAEWGLIFAGVYPDGRPLWRIRDRLHRLFMLSGDSYDNHVYHQPHHNRPNSLWMLISVPGKPGVFNIIESKHNKAIIAGDNYDNHVYHQNPAGRPNAEWTLHPLDQDNLKLFTDTLTQLPKNTQQYMTEITEALRGNTVAFSIEPNSGQWVMQPPANTIRDARGQLVCAATDRPGIGRAFQDNNKTWYCQFGGDDGQEHEIRWLVGTNPGQFLFLNINPGAVEWKPGTTTRAVRSITPTNPAVCRTNPGNGWPHQEFGWVYHNQCVLGWGGRSQYFLKFETLFVR